MSRPTKSRSTQPPRRQRARRAKVAHLPADIRTEIIRRLRDGHSQRAVLQFLNAKASVKAALRREHSGGMILRITDRNLSVWLASAPPEAAELNLKQ